MIIVLIRCFHNKPFDACCRALICILRLLLQFAEAVARRCSVKKGVLKNFTKFPGKHLYQSLFFNKVEETLSQVFSCQICEISKNTNFYRTYPVAASPNRGYLRCVILKALQAFLEERGLKVKGYAIFSSKCSK